MAKNKLAKSSMLEAVKLLGEQNEISSELIVKILSDSFIKAFEKNGPFDSLKPVELSKIDVNIDLDKEIIDIKRVWTVADKVAEEDRFTHIGIDNELLKGKSLKAGDIFEEEINLDDILYGKAQHIKVLFLQKLKEHEKAKLYEEFKSKKDQLIVATVFKYEKGKYAILEFEGASVFMPSREFLPGEIYELGQKLLVYILEIEKETSGAQIIASRADANFVRKLIEKEIDDVQDGVVEIVNIVREAGMKTKVAVKSNTPEVDPVGAIIGVKGSKIAPIITELKGERIDIIKWSDDTTELIKEAVLPAKIIGVKYESTEDSQTAIVIVEDDQFLPTIGKRGINVMLVAKLANHKIDVKTKTQASEENMEYEPVTYSTTRFSSNNNADYLASKEENFDFDELTLDEIAEMGDDIEDNDVDYKKKDEEE